MDPCKQEARVVMNHNLGHKNVRSCAHAAVLVHKQQLQKRDNNGQYTHEKMLDINSHLENENENHNEVLLQTDQDG